MLIWPYLRKYIWIHILICALYGLLFFAQLAILGEMFYNKGLNEHSLEETTYSFDVTPDNPEKIRELTAYKDNVRDVCLVVNDESFDIICYPNGVIRDRIDDVTFTYELTPGQVYLTSTPLITDIFNGEYEDYLMNDDFSVTIYDDDYDFNGLISIRNTYIKDAWGICVYMCESDFYKVMARHDKLVIAYTFAERLSRGEEEKMCNYVEEIDPSSAYNGPIDSSAELRSFADSSNVFIWITTFLAGLCFGRLMIILISNREPEYKIFELVGAKRRWIEFSRLRYILAVLTVSAAAGGLLYVLVQHLSDNILVYTRNSVVFWCISLLIYYSAAFVAVIFINLLERIKYGNEYRT